MQKGIKFLVLITAFISCWASSAFAKEAGLIRTAAGERNERDTYLEESFEGWWAPSGWSVDPSEGEGAWVQHNGSGSGGPGGYVFDGNFAAMFTNTYPSGTEGFLTTPEFDISSATDPIINFYWWNNDPNPNPCKIYIYTSVDGLTYQEFDMIEANLCEFNSWVEYLKPLSNDVIKIQLKAVSDQGGKNTYLDLFSIAEASTTPVANLNFESAYFGSGEIGGSYNIYGDIFTLTNNSGGTLTVNSITDLSSEDFSTDFDTSITLTAFESYSFNFVYEPTSAEHDSLHFEIDTNGGIAALDLTGDAYELPEGMVEIGIGSETGTRLPFDLGSKYSYAQSLYLQAEIDNADENIDTIQYYYDGNPVEQEITIYLGHTSVDTLSNWISADELTQVFQGGISLPEEAGWVEIPLTFPFAYNNSDNLVIAFDDNWGTSTYSSDFYSTNSNANMSVYYKNYSNNPDPENPPAIGTGWNDAQLSTYRPNIRMQFNEELSNANLLLNTDSAYYGNIETATTYDPVGDAFSIINNGPATLTITSITDLTSTDFSTNFDSSISLEFGESYSFGFIFAPQTSGFSTQEFELVTNGGTSVITLSGDSYDLPEVLEEIGVGLLLNKSLPIEPGNKFSYTQTLYPATELDNPQAQIGKLLYHFDGNGTWNSNIKIYMGHTTAETLTDWIPVSEMVQVFDGNLVTNEVDEWIEISLQAPFDYNGTDNLVIAIDKEADSNWNGDFYCSETANNNTIYFVNNNTNPDPANPPVVGTGYSNAKISTSIPNTRIEFQEDPTTPVIALNQDSAYYDFIMVGNNSDPHGEAFTIYNTGGGTLSMNSVTDLSGTDFSTTFDADDVSLSQGESYSFGFTYTPTAGEHDSLYFALETNGGTLGVNLTGDAYALAEGMVEIGTDVSTSNNYLPYDVSSNFSYTQTLYLQSELEQAEQQINTISYYFNGYSEHSDEVAIYMAHTEQTTLSDWISISEFTLVYNGTIDCAAEEGWVEINLQVPFAYNNSDNLVIATDENMPGSSYGNYAYCNENAENMSIYFKHYNNNVDPTDPPTISNSWGGAYNSGYRPNMRIQFGDLLTAPSINLNRTEGYYGFLEVGDSSNSLGDVYTIVNSGPDVLTVSGVTDLSSSSFTTNFVADSVSLGTGESYSFGFSYSPTAEAHDETEFTITSNGGVATINLSGDAYQFSGEEIEVGTDSLFNMALPVVAAAKYSYSQSLYKQNELNVSGKQITQIYYHYNGNSAFVDDIEVFMAHTSHDTLNSWLPNSEFVQVYTGELETHADDSWVRINLDTPFYYNNEDNLVIAVNEIAESQYSSWERFYVSDSNINMSISSTSNEDVIDPENLPEVDNMYGAVCSVYRPNIRIQMELAPLTPQELAVSNLGYASWTAPANVESEREFTHYNVRLDGEAVGTTTELFWQFDNLTAEQNYTAAISAVYEEGESELAELDFVFAPANIQNLTVNELGQVTWEAAATGRFSTSRNREFLNYNVYLDGVLLGNTTDLFWDFIELTDGQSYTAAISSVYEEGESSPSEAEFTFTLATPVNVAVDDISGMISWSNSGDFEEWLAYDDGVNNDGIGTNDVADFEVASRWETTDITAYDGMTISKIKFVPRELNCEYSVRVWSGADAANLLVDQIVSDFVIETWNEVELDTPVVIDASQELWFGYRCNTQAGFPAGTDAGPATAGYGDNIRMADGEWESISNAYDLDYNWNLGALVTTARGDEIALTPIVKHTSEKVSRNSASRSSFTAGNLGAVEGTVRDFTGYNVYLNGDLKAENISETEYTFENLINGTSYTGAVSTVYAEGESDLVEITFVYGGTGFDNNIIPVTALNGNYPNPFNPTTNISFSLKTETKVNVVIYNIKGEKVKTLVNGQLPAGQHKLSWNGKDNSDKAVASGVYFYRMQADKYNSTKKMMLLK